MLISGSGYVIQVPSDPGNVGKQYPRMMMYTAFPWYLYNRYI